VPEDKNDNSLFGAIGGTTGVDAGSGLIKKYGGTDSSDVGGKGYDIQLTGADFAVPEPATLPFAAFGIALLVWYARRQKHAGSISNR
jgi:hypothetical protein